MNLRRQYSSEDLHLAPQLEGLPDEERLRRFQRARRDAFMRRPALGTVLTFLPVLIALPTLALGALLAARFPELSWLLGSVPVVLAVGLGTWLSDRVRARLIARELERDGPFLL